MTECLSEQQIDDYLSDSLSDADERRLSDHVQQCQSCRELLNERTAIPDSFQQALADESPGGDSRADADLGRLLERAPVSPTVEVERADANADTRDGDASARE